MPEKPQEERVTNPLSHFERSCFQYTLSGHSLRRRRIPHRVWRKIGHFEKEKSQSVKKADENIFRFSSALCVNAKNDY